MISWIKEHTGGKPKRLRRLGEELITAGIIDEQQLRQALERQKQSGQFLGETLVQLNFVRPDVLGRYLAGLTGFPFVDFSSETVDEKLVRMLPEQVARKKLIVAYGEQDGYVKVALADPLNVATVDEVASRIGKRVIPHLALAADIEETLNRAYNVRHKAESLLEALPSELDVASELEDLAAQPDDAPIVRLVSNILEGAVSTGTSDIHIEPNEDNVRVRYRMDGLLHEQMIIPKAHLSATVSRIKILASMDIAERRRPQDGRFTVSFPNHPLFDARVSIMPTVFGEKVVIRLLQKSSSWATIPNLGFLQEQRALFEGFIKRPHGMLLVTGPTGSGKSTTLYAGLQYINDPILNINTIEDPVEYRLPGVNHVQVNPKIGVTFANGLRTLVRQDPDVIMVGEIRDRETAEIAVQAALTGHLVLSTLHTNDAPGALVRLQQMGIEPFLIASSVIGVLGQRLVRNICPHCRTTYAASDDTLRTFGIEGESHILAKGEGCRRCAGRGLRGRSAVYEVMPMTEPIRELVLRNASGSEIMEQAVAEGMRTMKQSGVQKMLNGETTPEELLRVLYLEG